MLEAQIEKDLKANAGPKPKSKKAKGKSKGPVKKAKTGVKILNVAKDLKNARSELKDRDDQIALLTDMLNSSVKEIKMREGELERLRKNNTFRE